MKRIHKSIGVGGLFALLAVSQWPFSAGNLDVVALRNFFYVLLGTYLVIYVLIGQHCKEFLRRLLTAPILLLIVSLVVSTFVGGFAVETIIGATHLGDGALSALMILLGVLALTAMKGRLNHQLIYLGGSAFAFLSLLNYLASGAYVEGVRAVGIMGQPILFATMLAIGYLYGFIYRKELRLSLPIWATLQALLLVLILASMTRAVIIPIVAYTVYELIKSHRLSKDKLQYTGNRAALLGMGFALLLIFFLSGAANRTISLEKLKFAVEYRGAMASNAITQADVVPLLGYGHGQIITHAGVYKQLPDVLQQEIDSGKIGVLDSAHNIFVDFWLQYGILGLVSIVWLIGLALLQGIRNFNKSKKAPPRQDCRH